MKTPLIGIEIELGVPLCNPAARVVFHRIPERFHAAVEFDSAALAAAGYNLGHIPEHFELSADDAAEHLNEQSAAPNTPRHCHFKYIHIFSFHNNHAFQKQLTTDFLYDKLYHS